MRSIALVLWLLAATGNEDPAAAALRAEIAAVVEGTTRASWTQTSWQRLGSREEFTAARCRWAGQDRIRLDVYDGRGKGAVAVLDGEEVTGYRRGLLSFARLRYPVRHPRVLSLRGHDMRTNGFLDEYRWLLDRWSRLHLSRDGARTVLRWIDDAGLDQRLVVSGSPPVVTRHEVRERGELVEVYTYAEVDYAADFDPAELFGEPR